MSGLALAARLARRELRSGFSGFRIFFASLVLGVAAIAAVGSLADALLSGIAEDGRILLGGDVAIELVHRPMAAEELRFAQAHGKISQTASMHAMAYALTNGTPGARQLIELKAVDGSYPLYGRVGLSPAVDLQRALLCSADVCGAVAEQSLLERLHIGAGGAIRIGTQRFRISATVTDEPDRLSGGFSLGPHVIISRAALARTGLVTLGSLIEYTTRIRLPLGQSISAFRREAKERFPDAGWQVRDRDHAAPGTDRFIRQLSVFLTLVGLTALAVGGVGAGQAVRAFLDRKREEIAAFKALGAEGGLIFLMFFLQVMAIAALASVTGVAIGATVPFLVERFFAREIPVPAHFGLYTMPLLLAFAFGALSAAAFAIPPLARAREIAPAGLLRDLVAPASRRGRLPYLIAAAVAGLLIVALALLVSPSLSFSSWFIACAGGGLVVLALAAQAVRWLFRQLPRTNSPALRLALANITRPGSPSAAVITALGLGLSLLAAVTILDATISGEVRQSLPGTAPTFYFVDIQAADARAFDRTIARFSTARDYRRTPMIRGRIVALKGVPASRAKVASDSKWALNGDRGITYAATPPKDTEIAKGRWWPANYHGPTLISFDADLARGMGLRVGDTMTINVLGREIEGRVANLRNVDFSTGRQNFVLILSPGIIDRAPHSFLATVRVAPRDEDAMYRAVTDRFPAVSTVRVKDVIAQLSAFLGELSFAVRAASLVAILAGLLVLAGAIAAGLRARLYDATVMKVVGATRAQIALAYGFEYALLGALCGLLALAAGIAAATLITRRVFEIAPVLDWRAVVVTIAGGALATLLFGLALTWSALSAKPAAQLRNL
ncbi:MAG TPA: FtsX-like permease family protein [Rhizomicrobium sp.]|jgi:putative ABC transport system permease protein|nr:FtsX-like permease family protein [Rhizomicrobium sp.]